MSRVALRVMCQASKHTVAQVEGSPDGYLVTMKSIVLTGYGHRFELVDRVHRLDGPADDPEVWGTWVGCSCGKDFLLSSMELRAALAVGLRVLVLPERKHPGIGEPSG